MLVTELDRCVVDEDLCLVRLVRFEHQRRAVPESLFGRRHRVERFDVGPDRLRGVDAGGERLGEHDSERLADETHSIDGQWWSLEVAVDRCEPVVCGHAEIRCGQYRHHAGHIDGIIDVDLTEDTMGDLGAHEHGVQPVVQGKVGEILGGSDEQRRVFGARHSGAEDRAGAGCGFGDRHHRRT